MYKDYIKCKGTHLLTRHSISKKKEKKKCLQMPARRGATDQEKKCNKTVKEKSTAMNVPKQRQQCHCQEKSTTHPCNKSEKKIGK